MLKRLLNLWPFVLRRTHKRVLLEQMIRHRHEIEWRSAQAADALAEANREFRMKLGVQQAALDEQIQRLTRIRGVEVIHMLPGSKFKKTVMFTVEVNPEMLRQFAAFELVDGRKLIADRVAEEVRKQIMDSKQWKVGE